MSAAYRDLHVNTSRDRMQFSDYPMSRSLPDFPHHTQIAAYFDAYVDRFGFRDRIFQTAVTGAERHDDAIWELTDEHDVRRAYDMLLVANGHHWNPRWPEPAFDGADSFAGQQRDGHRGRVLPVPGQMRDAIRGDSAATRKRYVASPRHTIQVDFDRYLHDLRCERRRGAHRARDAGFPLPVPARANEEMAAT